jgi:hypothetical protein
MSIALLLLALALAAIIIGGVNLMNYAANRDQW